MRRNTVQRETIVASAAEREKRSPSEVSSHAFGQRGRPCGRPGGAEYLALDRAADCRVLSLRDIRRLAGSPEIAGGRHEHARSGTWPSKLPGELPPELAITMDLNQHKPELIQLLTPEGERVEHPDYPLELSADEIKALYRDLVLVRRIDFEAIALQRQGELGIWASLLGQEAAQVGSGRALGPRDMAFPTYREHGVAWCRGLDPAKLLELYRGVSHGGWDPKAHNFHLYTIVIGAQTLHATGYAMGIQRDGAVGEDGEAVIAYFGDGATSQGDVNEAFIWASVNNAPVVFFCQNNQWAISEPLDRQTQDPALPAGAGLRLPWPAGGRQRRVRLPGGHPQGHAGGQGGPGPDADRGLHLPDGRAHHDRRPDQVPPVGRA